MADCTLCSFVTYFLLFLTGVLFIVYQYFVSAYKYWDIRGVQTIKPSIPFGNLGSIFDGKSHLSSIFKKIYDETNGPVGGFYRCTTPALVIKDVNLIKLLLVKDFTNFTDRGVHIDTDSDPLSGHLFRLKGDRWRELRIKLRPTFTSGKLKMMFPFLIQQGHHYENFLKEKAEKGEFFDAKDACIRYTLDVINSVAFGIDTNSFADPENEMRRYIREFFNHGISYRQGLTNYFAMSMPEIIKPLGLKIFNQKLTDFMFSLLRRIIGYREENKITRNDFLQLLIQLKNKGEVSQEDDAMDKSVYEGHKKEGLTFEELAAQAFVFLFAGYDTSASTMANTLFELSQEPEIQEKVRREIRSVLEKHDGKFSYQSVYEMDYLGMVIAETLRKYPPLPFLQRIPNEDYKVPGSDLVIEKGTSLFFSLTGLHYDPKHFPNPQKFDPERFSHENKEKIHPYSYMPFGEGPRQCIGMMMGRMQSRVGLAMILKDFSFSRTPETPKEITPIYGQILLNPSKPIILKVQKVH